MKTPLIERMEKRKAPKSWIAEVAKLQRTINEKDVKIEEYSNIIDVLAVEKEYLQRQYVDVVDRACEEIDKLLQEAT